MSSCIDMEIKWNWYSEDTIREGYKSRALYLQLGNHLIWYIMFCHCHWLDGPCLVLKSFKEVSGALRRRRWQNQFSMELSIDDDDKTNYRWSSPSTMTTKPIINGALHQCAFVLSRNDINHWPRSDQKGRKKLRAVIKVKRCKSECMLHTLKKKGNHQICKLSREKERSSIKIQAHIKTRWQGKPCIAHMIQKHGCLTWALHF
jgi:hypothetical protein